MAVATFGVYSGTYASGSNQANMNALYTTWGLLEAAYVALVSGVSRGLRRLGLSLRLN
jgi:hypothetical protein